MPVWVSSEPASDNMWCMGGPVTPGLVRVGGVGTGTGGGGGDEVAGLLKLLGRSNGYHCEKESKFWCE
jgi:hypothetical protein